MAGDKMKLYWISGSTPCWRVLIVLEEKCLQNYKQKQVDFVKQEQKGEEIVSRNPRGQVPTFEDDGVNICESHAICDYLERCYGDCGKRLIPKERAVMSQVLQRMHEAHNNFQQAVIENIIYYCMKTDQTKWDKDLLETKFEFARNELNRWEAYLTKVHEAGNDYIVGDDFTMADVYLYPHVAFCVRFGLDISKYPELMKYYNTLAQRPSIHKTWPPSWKKTNDRFGFLDKL
ncbi:glutathione S-transferase A-like [Mizuhopecten yessoensis]|uniref:Glutathione S-transferase A n=1 Tax=Mizuhopecten yessoensis TaxID=6573 RepID=A0A210PUH4_MIZYE|nr:glutathione S-transferase A-like [Mizuhopecten yessoensis]OWF40138.1 Glutathione S-transferase A [Mizuhopecten yessoensis]